MERRRTLLAVPHASYPSTTFTLADLSTSTTRLSLSLSLSLPRSPPRTTRYLTLAASSRTCEKLNRHSDRARVVVLPKKFPKSVETKRRLANIYEVRIYICVNPSPLLQVLMQHPSSRITGKPHHPPTATSTTTTVHSMPGLEYIVYQMRSLVIDED